MLSPAEEPLRDDPEVDLRYAPPAHGSPTDDAELSEATPASHRDTYPLLLEEDPRVRREAEALAAAGDRIEVFALRRPADLERETIHGVEVRRLGVQRHQGASLAVYLREYLSFFVRSGVALTRGHARRRFALVQVHTLPDFLVFATLPLRLTGVPVILDMHEAMPEFFASRFRGRTGWLGRILVAAQERAAVRFASAVVAVNDALGDRLTRMGVPRRR